MSSISILLIVLKATLFLFGALYIGVKLAPRVFNIASRFKAEGLLLATALGICFGFAYLAAQIDLAPIVGAFAAGLIMDEIHWRDFTERGEHSVDELIAPIAGFLVPIFFVRMGANVDLRTFAKPEVLVFAGALTLAAILGKQVCGLGVLQKGLDRLSVGIGMIPRGEVGLIFAAIGSKLVLDGMRVVNHSTYSAVVIMVVVTTMITPPALKWSMSRRAGGQNVDESASMNK
jgi:Kef-type K+ transport system membrane component KefB